MKKRIKINSIPRLFKLIYLKLFRINDTPQKVSLGLGLGVFLGILPGTGPVAALCLALLLRINRAAALLGSLITNTWLSIIILLPSIKVGSCIMRIEWQGVYQEWTAFLKNFHWQDLFKASILKIILPVIVGYIIVAFCIGLMVYLITLLAFTKIKYENKSRVNVSR